MKRTNYKKLAFELQIHPARSLEAIIKAKCISAIVRQLQARKLTHAELAKRSGIPRSAVTGIISGSLQKVTLNRLFRLLEALELKADISIKEAA